MIITSPTGDRLWWDAERKEWRELKEMPQTLAYQYLALKSALKLEMKGMKRSKGRSAYAILKAHGYQGSRESVMDMLKADVQTLLAKKEASP